MKHTPGPWTTEHDAIGDLRIETATQSLADVQIWSHGAKGNPEENAANARLMAASPELLEACRQMRREYAAFGTLSQETQVQADNAIWKAEPAR